MNTSQPDPVAGAEAPEPAEAQGLGSPTTTAPEAPEVPSPEAAPEATAPAEAEEAGAAPTEPAAPDEPATVGTTPDEPAAEAPATAKPAPGAAAPAPKPRPVPKPSALRVSRPAAKRPGATPTAPTPVVPPADAAAEAQAKPFGRVDDDGTVYVTEQAGERSVGQMPGASKDEALSFYVRRYLDLVAKVAVFEARLGATDLSVREIDQTLAKLVEETAEPSAVGDLDALRARLEALKSVADERRKEADAARRAAREEALVARTEIVEEAETIAGTDPQKMQWRQSGARLRTLLDEWKAAQQAGPRIDRPAEDALWKRFSAARTAFDRQRRHYFADLETRNAAAKAAKTALVAEAEKLATSTDWGPTAGSFRDLMTQWKAAGRASRTDDDALWEKFRGAQDAFFAARDAANARIDEEYGKNLEVKEAILAEAEKLVPVTDLAAAKASLRALQERWDAAGKVPRGSVQSVEGRMHAVERAVRDAEQAQWRRTNPETKARAEGAAAQLEAAIAGLEADLAAAEAAGDKRSVAEAKAALDARKSWLEQVLKAAEES